jgi:hypothetical protein
MVGRNVSKPTANFIVTILLRNDAAKGHERTQYLGNCQPVEIAKKIDLGKKGVLEEV